MITLIVAKTKCTIKKYVKKSVEMSRKTLIEMLKNSANVKNEKSELGIEYILSLQYEYEQGSLLKSKYR